MSADEDKPAKLVIDKDAYYTPQQWSLMSGYSLKSLATFRSKRRYFPFIRIGGRCFYHGAALINVLEQSVRKVSNSETSFGGHSRGPTGLRISGGRL
jgi:hypothetical protein